MKFKDRQEKEELIIKSLGERPKNLQSWTDMQVITMFNKIIYIQKMKEAKKK
jgi:hypothetical protein